MAGELFMAIAGVNWCTCLIVVLGSAANRIPSRMTILAASTVLLGLILKFVAGGWVVLFLIWWYLGIGVTHVVIHRKASQSIPENRPLAIVSNVLLLMAFLVQFDVGDGTCRWTTVTALLYGPGFEPSLN
jgi:uncharacterized membrane protein